MTKIVKLPMRILIESLQAERRLLESFDILSVQILDREDRERFWELRSEALRILIKDRKLKEGVRWELTF
jgi:hypothetical protein